MKLFLVFFISITALSGIHLQAQPADSLQRGSLQPRKFDPRRDAARDIENAMVEAAAANKRIFLDVGGEWCIWCHRLDSLFIRNKDLADYLNEHYVVVKVNVSKENENRTVLGRYPKVAGYPHIFILNEKGVLLRSQDTGELEYPQGAPIKGHDREKVFAFLRKWAR